MRVYCCLASSLSVAAIAPPKPMMKATYGVKTGRLVITVVATEPINHIIEPKTKPLEPATTNLRLMLTIFLFSPPNTPSGNVWRDFESEFPAS